MVTKLLPSPKKRVRALETYLPESGEGYHSGARTSSRCRCLVYLPCSLLVLSLWCILLGWPLNNYNSIFFKNSFIPWVRNVEGIQISINLHLASAGASLGVGSALLFRNFTDLASKLRFLKRWVRSNW